MDGDGGPTQSEAGSSSSSSAKTTRDSYVVVPGNAPFADLVSIVLARIGFTPLDTLAAKGVLRVAVIKML